MARKQHGSSRINQFLGNKWLYTTVAPIVCENYYARIQCKFVAQADSTDSHFPLTEFNVVFG